MKKYLLLLLFSLNSFGAVWTVDTNTYGITREAIARAITNSASGDTIIIPGPGLYSITNVIIMSKAIKFVGSGTNSVVISDDNISASRGSMTAGTFYCVQNDQNNLLSFENICFTSTNSAIVTSAPLIRLDTRSALWMFRGCYFSNYAARVLYQFDTSSNRNNGGVISSNYFHNPRNGGGIFFDEGQPGNGDNGYYAHSHDILWGTTNFTYLEHNTMSNGLPRAFVDGRGGRSVAIRYNFGYRIAWENHELSAKDLGFTALEIYGNYQTNDITSEAAILIRSGTAIIYSNNVVGNYPALLKMVYYRALCSAPGQPLSPSNPWGVLTWHSAIGTNGWDWNNPTQFSFGTNNAPDPSPWQWYNARMCEDTNKSYTINQWTGYSLINLNTGYGGLIQSNSTTKIWMYDPGLGGVSSNQDMCFWTNGHTYEIRKLIQPFENIGVGKGDVLCCGGDFVNASPYGFPHEINEPIYYWNNIGTTSVSPSFYGTFIVAGQNYTNAIKPGYIQLPDPHPLSSGIPFNPPSISVIPDLSILENTATTNISFTIGDVETPAGSLILTKGCNNTTLVPLANIVFGGANSNRTVNITPNINQFGMASITIIVTDTDGYPASRTFNLTVIQTSNSIPTISVIANQNLATNSSTGVLNFVINDVETPATSLVVTSSSSNTNCIPNNFVVLGGTSTNRTVNVLSTNVYGNSTINLSVSDGTTNAISTFIVSVPTPQTNLTVRAGQVNVGRLIFTK